MTPAVLIARLVDALPGFQPSDPELLSVTCDQAVHFLADRSRDTDQTEFERDLRNVLEILEAAAEGADPTVYELILVDFIEMVHLFGPRCQEVAAKFGPHLQAAVAEWEATYSRSMGPLCPDAGTFS